MDLSLGRGGSGSRLRIQLVGAGVSARAEAFEKMAGESNYLLGSDPTAWHTHVPHYRRVVYSGIYPGIDLAFYGNDEHLEHDFIVAPGADVSSIRMGYSGARSIFLDRAGALHVSLGAGEVLLRAPQVYQVKDGVRIQRVGRFVLHRGEVGFAVAHVDHTAQLVIDPVLDFATYLANQSLYVNGVATDPQGNTYMVGETFSSSYPVTAGAAQPTCKSCPTNGDVFVTKLNATGSAQVYSTYIGGNNNDQPDAIAVDKNGNAVVTGFTTSTDYPLKNPIASGVASYQDGFLTSLTPDGSAFNFSSRLGGSTSQSSAAMTYPQALATDSSGNVYVSGTTESPFLPVTAGALHAGTPAYSKPFIFLTKLQLSGSLVFSALVGDPGQASGGVGTAGLAVDGANNIYMGGTVGQTVFTTMTPWPTTPGAYQSQVIGSNQNAPFGAKISPDGSTLLYSSLLGSGRASALALDSSGEILLAGTAGSGFPTTSNGYSTTSAATFLARLSSDASSLTYSSYFNSAANSITGVAFDGSGNLWLTGRTSGGLPLVNPLQSSSGSTQTSFIAEFDPQIKVLLFSTYLNGPLGGTQTAGVALDQQGRAHIAGVTQDDLPTTSGAYLGSVTPPPPNYTYTYGFAALIDTNGATPAVCVTANRISTAQVGTSVQGSFTFSNCGTASLNVSSVQLQSAGSLFSLASSSTCVGSLAVGASCTDFYNFMPTVAGIASATVTVNSNAPVPTAQITITGFATAPKLALINNTVVFNPQVLGVAGTTQQLTILNQGAAPLVINTAGVTLTGPFSIVSSSCGSPVPPPSGTTYACSFVLSYQPIKTGTDNGSITIPSNDPLQNTVTATLTGTSLAAYTLPMITQLEPTAVALGGAAARLVVIGLNFFPTSSIVVGGEPLPTTFVSSTALQATVDSSLFTAVGELPVVVVNSAPGGSSASFALPVYRSVSVSAASLLYEPVSKLLFASIPSTATSNPNTVLPIDPLTGLAGTPIPVGNNPGKLAASPDGSAIFVGLNSDHTLQRINLTTRAVDRTFPLPLDSLTGVTTVNDMHVVPGSPKNVVVSLSRPASPGEAGAALYTDTGLASFVPNTYSSNYYTLDSFSFVSDPTQFFGYPFSGNYFGMTKVSATTLTPVTSGFSCCTQATGSRVASDGTLLFTNSGEVWDPKTQTLLGTYVSSGSPNGQLFYEPSVVPDASVARTFFLDTFINSDSILSFDPGTYKQVGILSIPEQNYPAASDLVRWGPDGFAFRVYSASSADAIVILRSSLAQTGTAPAPALSSLAPATAILGSPTFSLTVNGSGFLPGSIALWNGIPHETTFNTSGQLTVLIPLTDLATAGSAQVTVANPSGTSMALPFLILGPALTVTPAALAFGSQAVGAASAPLTITLTNSGFAPLSTQGFTFPITGSSDFMASSTCPATLTAASSCTIAVVFKPSTVAAESGTLTVTFPGLAAKAVALSGTGVAPDFMLSGSGAVTVTAGNSGVYALTLTAVNGFNGSVTFACSNLPAYANCTFTPSSSSLSASSTVSLSITTAAAHAEVSTPRALRSTKSGPEIIFSLLGLLGMPVFAGRRRLRGSGLMGFNSTLLLLTAFTGAWIVSGCGGQPNNSTTGTPGTPTGAYTINVTATSGNVTHTIPLTLSVQ